MLYPRIYLSVDNCFASKRWTSPGEWMAIIRELGIAYVEASADNECDPLYMGASYLSDWVKQVNTASREYGVQVASLYSGHGTYATLGLAHTDSRIRGRFLHDWLEPMADMAGSLHGGLGFFCHAFSDAVLQEPALYGRFRENLYDDLAELASYTKDGGCRFACVEQMYSPHQIPWTIEGARHLIREVYGRGGAPFYITIDLGHQTGQRKFRRPPPDEIRSMLRKYREGQNVPQLWLGAKSTMGLFELAARNTPAVGLLIDQIDREMDRYPYMFAGPEDGDPYSWLRGLACYSPVIHLQQTDGLTSSHQPFTGEFNEKGIVSALDVLRAIFRAYENASEPGMPPRCPEIFLTLELFTGTAEISRLALDNLRESVSYWRRYVPEDGLPLDTLLKKADGQENIRAEEVSTG